LGSPLYRLHAHVKTTLESEFPGLGSSNWKVRSPADKDYNCHAWGMCETRVRWEPTPDDYWPPGLKTGLIADYTLDSFVRAYFTVGFRECAGSNFEFGFQKIAIYSELNFGEEWPQHTARQTLLGRGWLSKMGYAEDIRHKSVGDLEGAKYGRVRRYMKRSWYRALIDPSSVWIRATIEHWKYRRKHPLGI
jgi:hypothetical protein